MPSRGGEIPPLTAVIPRRTLRLVRELAHAHGLLPPGPLVVAVSGGTDSTALLLILAALRDELGLVLHVAHFDHRARPRSAVRDLAAVAALAERCGATFRAGRADAALASEDAARRARYAFLRRAAAACGASGIATGHTRDDQAETVLLHLTRGSGLTGLAAMRPSRDGVVRPLLTLGRVDTAAVCGVAGVTPREDPSNRSLAFARNRIRHRVLPELGRLNPRVAEALARVADAAAGDEDALESAARDLLLAARVGDAIDLDRLGSGTLALRALAQAWRVATGTTLGSRHRAALAAEAARRTGSAALALPGGQVVREYARLRFVRSAGGRRAGSGECDGSGEFGGSSESEEAGEAGGARRVAPRLAGVVPFVRDVPLDWGGWRLILTSSGPPAGFTTIGTVPGAVAAGLGVRARRPGDRIARGGKLQDLLTDAKVPVRLRSTLPLIIDAAGRVRLVPGIHGGIDRGIHGGLQGGRPPGEVPSVAVHARPPLGTSVLGIIRGPSPLHGLALTTRRVLVPPHARGAQHEPR